MRKEDQESGFISHLAELRKRLIHSFIFLIIFFLFCYLFAEHLYGFLVDPFAQAVKDDGTDRRLIFTALQETFLTYLKVAFFASFLVEMKLFFCLLFLTHVVENVEHRASDGLFCYSWRPCSRKLRKSIF